MPDLLGMTDASSGAGDRPAPHTGGEPGPGAPKAPHLAPPSTEPSQIWGLRPLLGMMVLTVTCVILIALLHDVGPLMDVIAVLAVLCGVAWVVRTVLRLTADDEPEPTARVHEAPQPEHEDPIAVAAARPHRFHHDRPRRGLRAALHH